MAQLAGAAEVTPRASSSGARRRNALIDPNLIVDKRIRHVAECVVRRLETAAPESFIAYFLIGSHTDDTAVPGSDVDLVAIVRSHAVYKPERLLEMKASCSQDSSIRVSLQLRSLDSLARSQRSLAQLRQGSVLLLGEDCRPRLPAVDVAAFARETVSLSRCLMALGRARNESNPSLDHPDENDEFYGRARVTIPSLYQPPAQEGTKELVKGILWSATALLAVQFGVVVGSARQAVERYREEDGEWWRFVRDSSHMCKHAWNYEVPRRAHERSELRSICRQLLEFENDCMTIYRSL